MACKISKRIEEREISLEEFILQKNLKKFSDLRFAGKALNFLMIFSGSPRVFVRTALETAWTKEQADTFIKENNLQELKRRIEDRHPKDNPTMISYLTVATFMKNEFFKLYKGLQKRIDDNRAFARTNGYVRTIFGAKRALIEELLRGEFDDREYSAMMRNLDNICANTDIQNFEASIVHKAMADMDEEYLVHKKSKIWNCVHDSVDFYVHKSELAEVAMKAKEYFERELPELKGVPLKIDFTVSDLKKGDYYKGGRSLSSFGVYID